MYQGVTDMIGFGVVSATVAGPATSLSQVASATSALETITVPAGVIAGDLLVLLDRAEDDATTVPTTVVPTGFTSIINTAHAQYTRSIMSYKIAVGTEASSSITGMNGTAYESKAMYVFRGNNPITSVTAASAAGQFTESNPTAQVVTASAGAVPLVVLAGYSVFAANAVDPRTFSTTKDGEISNGTDLYLAYKIYNSSPADTTVDMDDEGFENCLQSCYLQVS